MKARSIVLLLAMSLAGSGAALAAANAMPEQRCVTLKEQYETALKNHASFASFAAAKKLGDKGIGLCQAKSYRQGSDDLEKALKQLGVAVKN